MDVEWSQQTYKKIILAARKQTKQMLISSFPKLLQTHSVHQILYYKSGFIPHVKLWLGYLIFPSPKRAELCSLSVQAFWIHILFTLHMMSVCSLYTMACAFSVIALPASVFQALSMRSEAFIFHPNISPASGYLGSFTYLYYLLSSPRAHLQSIDKNWFLSCE